MALIKSRGDPWEETPYNRFSDFIAPGADRYRILSSLIDSMGFNSLVFPIGGRRHFFIFPSGHRLNIAAGFPFRGRSPVILAAHYDRVVGSPGANDNSAAVFQILKTALRLLEQKTDYWIIIFTDGEELGAGEGFENQGSFALAEMLRQGGLGDARVFIFDACGTGDTMVVSSTTDYILRNEESAGTRRARQLIGDLREHALETARNLRLEKVLVAPTPFSDDGGFLRAGILAQTICMLPTEEAAPYASLLRMRPEFADFFLAGAIQDTADRFNIPETWRCLNGPSDSRLRLTPMYFDRVV
ncbi:MAG: Zn-dependent exopeptidase M28, partial [Treponema sp.]|nr:Zn-dependent exopeptidase M28 [Treponema sp.]